MAGKTASTTSGRAGDRVPVKPKRVVEPHDELTAAEAKKVRRALQQVRDGNTIPWSQIKNELGL